MAGFLPFSAIYIELHYIFASLWGHKIYTLFGILYLAFVMLVIVRFHNFCISDNALIILGDCFHYRLACLLSAST